MSLTYAELLRRRAFETKGGDSLLEGSADELDRLAEVEARYARAEKAIEIADDQVTKLEAENERLREALEPARTQLLRTDPRRVSTAATIALLDAALAQTTEKDHD